MQAKEALSYIGIAKKISGVSSSKKKLINIILAMEEEDAEQRAIMLPLIEAILRGEANVKREVTMRNGLLSDQPFINTTMEITVTEPCRL